MLDTPNFTTALTTPLNGFEQTLISQHAAIEQWFAAQWQNCHPPMTCSVDLRNAGYKLAAVDTNLFPAGFNNLGEAAVHRGVVALKQYLQDKYPDCQLIVLIPESHTRHAFYYQNIAILQRMLIAAGYETRLGSLLDTVTQAQTIELSEGNTLTLEALSREGDALFIANKRPDLIVLNNDLSHGLEPMLQNLEQPILPDPRLGWATRTKSVHFAMAAQINESFAQRFQFDSWLINPIFRVCDNVSFVEREGEACLANHIAEMLAVIQSKYDEYGIEDKPFVMVKADAGTYGMGIMTVHEADDIYHLNRKQRAKMASLKGQRELTRVIIQEGIRSIETTAMQAVAEPVLYMLGCQVVGGFYRAHEKQTHEQNLNVPGMTFTVMQETDDMLQSQRSYSYSVIARLALLAAAQEAQALEKGEQ